MKVSTTIPAHMTPAYEQFCSEFGELPAKFNEWQLLNNRCQALEMLLTQQPWLSPLGAAQYIESAKNCLVLGKPYRIVVLGEAGYGKSLLLNILIGRKILPSKDAGALTALATYVYCDVEESQQESLKIISPAQMDESTRKFCGEVLKLTANFQISVELPLGVQQPVREFWERHLNSKANLQTTATQGQPRIEYHLRRAPANANSATSLGLHNVVFVDTPGTGSENESHMLALRQELLNAQAIIYLAKFPRPDLHAKALAQLLRETVFKDFDDAHYQRFAGKVLLVVNKFTTIDPDDPAIRTVVDELRRQIYGSQETAYPYQPAEAKAHIVELRQAALAQVKMNGGSFSQAQEETDYAGYEGSYRKEVELSGMAVINSAAIPEALWVNSRVPQFMQALQEFLSTQRLIQMLSEATYHWQRATTTIKEECAHLLNEHHVNERLVRNKAERAAYLNRLKNEECKIQLTKDKAELQRKYTHFRDELVRWLDTHAAEQGELIKQIHAAINQRLQQQLKTMDDWTFETLDLKRRRKHTDTIWPQVRLRIEKALLQVIEDTARERLSSYYIEKFNGLLRSHELHSAILQKFYDQPYLEEHNLLGRLERAARNLADHFTNICCWTLVYELERSEQSQSHFRKPPGVQNPAPKVAPFSTVAVVNAPKTTTNGGENSHPTEHLLQTSTHPTLHDNEILEGFTTLYQTAFQQVQQLLDTLFINELIRYEDIYQEIVNSLHEEHTHNLSSAQLKNMLFKEYSIVRVQIDKAIAVLDQLEQLITNEGEPDSVSSGRSVEVTSIETNVEGLVTAEVKSATNGYYKTQDAPL